MSEKNFTFLKLLNRYNGIKIPVIQRDYVQGLDENRRIAENLLKDLRDSVENGKEGIHLDFLYGSDNSGNLILIDGQQRITTLFLLYWYLLFKRRELLGENEKKRLIGLLSKFSYEIRPSTEDFIKYLLKNLDSIEDNGKLSDSIRNESWFTLSWECDPTVKSMLNMLDLINEFFGDLDRELTIEEIDKKITFSFLDLEELQLTDDVYVKMNSRGKPLTEFEIFKAEIGNVLYNYYGCKYSPEDALKIVSKLDNQWLDIFWKVDKGNPEKAERIYFNFLENISFLFYVEQLDREAIRKERITPKDFSLLKDWEKVYLENEVYLDKLVKILNILESYEDSVNWELLKRGKSIFRDFLKPHVGREEESINYHERVRFYALALFMLKKGNPSEHKEVYRKWLRVSLNVINNTRIEEISDLKSIISLLKSWIDNVDNLYKFLLKADERPSQVKEEKKKIKLIMENPEWEKEIMEAEKHEYLDGQIGFLIDMSEGNLDQFRKYRDTFKRLFNKRAKIEKDYQTLIHRALLTYGNYLPQHGNSTKYTFCTFGTQLREKEENWRRVFNDGSKRSLLKKLLDDLYGTHSIEEKLKEIVNNFLSANDFSDWRYLFIDNKELLKGCRNYQIMMRSKNQIYLNRGNTKVTNWNWKRKAELYTYYFYLTFLKRNQNEKPLMNYEVSYSESSDYDSIGIVISGILLKNVKIELWITFQYGREFLISAYVYDSDGNSINPYDEFCSAVREKLQNIGFKIEDDEFMYSKFYLPNEMNELLSDIFNICEKIGGE